jgi:hypothetical protein
MHAVYAKEQALKLEEILQLEKKRVESVRCAMVKVLEVIEC